MPHQCTNCGHVFEDGSKEMLSGCPDCGGNKFQYHPGEVAEEEPPDAESPEPPEAEGGSVAGAVGRAANKVRDAVTSDPDPAARTTGDDADASSSADAVGSSAADASETADAADTASSPTADAIPEASSGASTGDAGTDDEVDPAAPETEARESVSEADASASDTSSPDPAASDASASSAPETGGEPEGSDPNDAGIDATAEVSDEDAAQADARSSVVDKDSLPDAPSEGRVVKEPDDSEDRPDLDDLRQELNDQFESIRIVAPGQYELNLMELYDRQEYIIALQEDGQYVIEVPDAWETDEA
ncbi:Zn-ribbon containing protein [Halobacterium sp. R2-5]|uniref:OapC/ArvC family zinc-ribbon domain-containing protein n=1 Tax=Halobacterium sp. R2-5 TaxID=2715751 RepID=UPI001421A041|nr:Zn-ribbon containing protein [Halobacterium sp. R2-5]NIB98278.1 hypothetical protein [Halobacterium sp. R2-5]